MAFAFANVATHIFTNSSSCFWIGPNVLPFVPFSPLSFSQQLLQSFTCDDSFVHTTLFSLPLTASHSIRLLKIQKLCYSRGSRYGIFQKNEYFHWMNNQKNFWMNIFFEWMLSFFFEWIFFWMNNFFFFWMNIFDEWIIRFFFEWIFYESLFCQ